MYVQVGMYGVYKWRYVLLEGEVMGKDQNIVKPFVKVDIEEETGRGIRARGIRFVMCH